MENRKEILPNRWCQYTIYSITAMFFLLAKATQHTVHSSGAVIELHKKKI